MFVPFKQQRIRRKHSLWSDQRRLQEWSMIFFNFFFQHTKVCKQKCRFYNQLFRTQLVIIYLATISNQDCCCFPLGCAFGYLNLLFNMLIFLLIVFLRLRCDFQEIKWTYVNIGTCFIPISSYYILKNCLIVEKFCFAISGEEPLVRLSLTERLGKRKFSVGEISFVHIFCFLLVCAFI